MPLPLPLTSDPKKSLPPNPRPRASLEAALLLVDCKRRPACINSREVPPPPPTPTLVLLPPYCSRTRDTVTPAFQPLHATRRTLFATEAIVVVFVCVRSFDVIHTVAEPRLPNISPVVPRSYGATRRCRRCSTVGDPHQTRIRRTLPECALCALHHTLATR